jgi:hypothetical protein
MLPPWILLSRHCAATAPGCLLGAAASDLRQLRARAREGAIIAPHGRTITGLGRNFDLRERSLHLLRSALDLRPPFLGRRRQLCFALPVALGQKPFSLSCYRT